MAPRRRRAVRPAPVDPWTFPPPWREHLRAAVEARRRFGDALASLPEGPTRARVSLLDERLDHNLHAAAVTARRGALLTTANHAARVNALSAELADLAAHHAALDPAARRHEAAVAAELRSLRRAEKVGTQALEQVRLLATRLDDAVTALVELSMGGGDDRGALQSVLDEIEALRSVELG